MKFVIRYWLNPSYKEPVEGYIDDVDNKEEQKKVGIWTEYWGATIFLLKALTRCQPPGSATKIWGTPFSCLNEARRFERAITYPAKIRHLLGDNSYSIWSSSLTFRDALQKGIPLKLQSGMQKRL